MKTKSQIARAARLLPGGVPRYVRAYDNGGKTADRYTVCFTGKAATMRAPGYYSPRYSYLAMSANPFHPQGFGQHGETFDFPADSPYGKWAPAISRKCHLGTRIAFADLPADCQKFVLRDYREIWGL